MRGTDWSSWLVCLRSFNFGDGASVGVVSERERVFKVDFIGVQRADAPPRPFTPSRVGGRGGVSESERGSLRIASSLDVGFITSSIAPATPLGRFHMDQSVRPRRGTKA
jgi:hypothetical protein